MTEAVETQANIATLPPEERAMVVLQSRKATAELTALANEATSIVAVIDPAGREQAHRLGMRLKKARTAIEKIGKEAREDAQAFSKAVIAEEKRLKAIIEPEETRVLGLRDGYDEKVRLEEQAKAAAEAKRVADIREKIDAIRSLPMTLTGAPSADLAAEVEALSGFQPNPDVFAEFTAECVDVVREAHASLKELLARVKRQEETAALLAAERERLAEERRQVEEQLAAERKQIEEQRARMQAELDALRAERDALKAATEPEPEPQPEPQPEPDPEPEPEAVIGKSPEPIAEPDAPPPPTDDWQVRRFCLATAGQFEALARKVLLCGYAPYAQDLQQIADSLRKGVLDESIGEALAESAEDIIKADNGMIDASVTCVEILENV